jgi:hypothetical protein
MRIFTHPPANPLLGGVPFRAGWVNLRYTTSINLLKSIHSRLEGFSYGVYPPRPFGHPSWEGICQWGVAIGVWNEIDRNSPRNH